MSRSHATVGDDWMMTVDDPELRWAVTARRVVRVIDGGEWEGESPVDVASCLGVRRPPGALRTARVMVIATDEGALPLLARGSISLERATAEALAPLPQIVRDAGCADALLGLLLRDASAAAFVVAPERLCAAPDSPSPPVPSRSFEENEP
jgi:hypothetical protein